MHARWEELCCRTRTASARLSAFSIFHPPVLLFSHPSSTPRMVGAPRSDARFGPPASGRAAQGDRASTRRVDPASVGKRTSMQTSRRSHTLFDTPSRTVLTLTRDTRRGRALDGSRCGSHTHPPAREEAAAHVGPPRARHATRATPVRVTPSTHSRTQIVKRNGCGVRV